MTELTDTTTSTVVDTQTASRLKKLERPANGYPFTVVTLMDYTNGDPAIEQIHDRIYHHLPPYTVVRHSPTDVYSPVQIGFRLATRYLSGEENLPHNVVFVGNTAPRHVGIKNCRAVPFVHAKLEGGIHYLGTLSPDGELAFLKHRIVGPVRQIDIQVEGTQFRSLGLGLALRRLLVDDLALFVSDDLSDQIGDVPEGKIGDWDNFGNLKLTYTSKHAFFQGHNPGDKVGVSINGITSQATLAEYLGQFGGLTIQPGSTVHKDAPYMEVTINQGSAKSHFGDVASGADVTLSWL